MITSTTAYSYVRRCRHLYICRAASRMTKADDKRKERFARNMRPVFEKCNVTYLIVSTRGGGASVFFLRDKFLCYSTATFQMLFDLMFLSSITINGNPSNERTNAHEPLHKVCSFLRQSCLKHICVRWR